MFELIVFFCLAVIVSFVCSLSEAGLLSLRRPDVMRLKESGHWSGKVLEKLTADVDRPLAGILTVNTLANCVGAAGVGSAAAKIWGGSGMAVASAVLTMCILVFSEIIPKTLGASYAVRLSGFIAVAVRGMLVLTYPIVLVMRQISKLIGSGPQKYSREDITLAAKIGLEDGVVDEGETQVIANVLKVARTSVGECMTPRDQVVTYAKDRTVEDVAAEESLIQYSRFPIYGSNPDEIVGLVRRESIRHRLHEGHKDTTLEDIALMPAPTISVNATLRVAANEMEHHKSKALVVVDDQDRFCGIVTEHSIESLVFAGGISGEYAARWMPV